ncbi:related to integral membrane [Lecanosticta acicola]|uniref:Related to integral membrane n=1 Tax=Lecanosticta acicola TaxID=111012 RepID=A0AAI8Z8A3_9PEZI|nr:related to integral membrane [Lecanosticta acicola]
MKFSGHASQPAIYAVVFTSTVIAILAIALRLYTRFAIVRAPALDDLLATLALGFLCLFTACVALLTYYGLGRHQADLTETEQRKSLLSLWISVMVYHVSLWLAKVSIIFQCLEVLGSIRWLRIAAWTLAAIVTCFTIYTVFATIFICKPISLFWNQDQIGSCLSRLPLWYAHFSFGIATDIAVAVLPLPVIRSLRLPKRERNMLIAVLALGGSVCIASIIRSNVLYAMTGSHDESWRNAQVGLYSSIEASWILIAACLPTYNAFVAKFFPQFCVHAGPYTQSLELADVGASEPRKAGTVSMKITDDGVEVAHPGLQVDSQYLPKEMAATHAEAAVPSGSRGDLLQQNDDDAILPSTARNEDRESFELPPVSVCGL